MTPGVLRADLTLPMLRLNVPTPAESHFLVAESLVRGAEVLAAAENTPYRALALVTGHALETMLKAFLCHAVGEPAARAVKHDLAAGWAAAACSGLSIGLPMPDWAVRLHPLHGSPHKGRYPQRTHAFAWPNTAETAAGLAEILGLVRARIIP